MMYTTFELSLKFILNSNVSELPNDVPYVSVRSRTTSMLLERIDRFPNMIY